MDDATDTPNAADQLDGEVLGEKIGDDGLPGTQGYPPEQAVGVNDPNLVADDDFAMRTARSRAESTAGTDRETVRDLLTPPGDDSAGDNERQALAGRSESDQGVTAAEVDALHMIDE